MTTRTAEMLDTGIGQVKAARDHLRHDTDVMASDLSAVIGTLRELIWTIDTFTATIADAYGQQHDLGHDDGHDTALVVARIVEHLAQTRRYFDNIDGILADVHNHAARLHNNEH
jgi:Mg2+ and Co2+ transporter CorA